MCVGFLLLFEIRRVIDRLLVLLRRHPSMACRFVKRSPIRFLTGIVSARFFAHQAPPNLQSAVGLSVPSPIKSAGSSLPERAIDKALAPKQMRPNTRTNTEPVSAEEHQFFTSSRREGRLPSARDPLWQSLLARALREGLPDEAALFTHERVVSVDLAGKSRPSTR
jgi:hypothetical protein